MGLLTVAFSSNARADDSQKIFKNPVYFRAISELSRAYKSGAVKRDNVLAIVNFNLPSSRKRLWIIDRKNRKVLFYGLVSHGKNSGKLYATDFSNKSGSYQSSLGAYSMGKMYRGKHGPSLKMHGLDKGLNHRAFDRHIVIHSAGYVSRKFIQKFGRLGRSHGCPAVSRKDFKTVMKHLKPGTFLYIYHHSLFNKSGFGDI